MAYMRKIDSAQEWALLVKGEVSLDSWSPPPAGVLQRGQIWRKKTNHNNLELVDGSRRVWHRSRAEVGCDGPKNAYLNKLQ